MCEFLKKQKRLKFLFFQLFIIMKMMLMLFNTYWFYLIFFDFGLSVFVFAAFMLFVVATQSFFSPPLMRIRHEEILNIISNYDFNQSSHANKFVDNKTHIYVIFKKITKIKIDFENNTIHFHYFCECKWIFGFKKKHLLTRNKKKIINIMI